MLLIGRLLIGWLRCKPLAFALFFFAAATTVPVSVHAASITFREGSFGSTCFTQPVPFGYYSFTYSMALSQPVSFAPGCSASQILITPIYMSGTCLQALNTYSTSCDSSVQNPIIVSGPTSSAGQSISTSDSSGICNQAFSQSSTSLASAGSSSPFFSGTVTCAPSTLGYFYIQNNCPPTNESSIITIVVNYNPTSGNGILYDNNYCNNYYSSWDSWGRWVTLAVVISSILVFGLLFIFLRRRRRLQAVNQVQMMSMPQQQPTQPPHGYYGQPYSAYSTSPPSLVQPGPVTGYPVEPGPGVSDPYYGKPPT